MSTTTRPVVIVSNRGPVTFTTRTVGATTTVSSRRGSGGLVSGLGPLLDSGQALWVAAALSEGDRLAAALKAGETGPDVVLESTDSLIDLVEFVTMDDDELSLYYDVISNETLWFIHHGLFDLVRTPNFDDAWWAAWRTYESINARFAEVVSRCAPPGAAVLIQDYHLTLVGEFLRASRPDLGLVHFHHTPFSGPDNVRVLPDAARQQMLRALADHDVCGFHEPRWARNFEQCLEVFGIKRRAGSKVLAATLSSNISEIRDTARSDACNTEFARINERFSDQKLIVRVDRMELSKNIVRGFEAFDLLLERRPDLRGRVSFLACCYPSRENVAAYRRYRQDVEDSAARVNAKWSTPEWTPIDLETDDNYPRSVAALRRYDALLVNPIRDGLNLVAKEGPAVNERYGQLVLSTQAGVYTELSGPAFGVHPFDLSATATALAEALDLGGGERRIRATELVEAATARTPSDWLEDQLSLLQSRS